MRLPILLALSSCLLHFTAVAQTTVSGRVLDAKSGEAIAGATILKTGTTEGTSSNADGDFTLTVSESSDSVALSFSSIGYVTQQRRVAPGNNVTKLALNTKYIECLVIIHQRIEIGLTSGVRYTPFGGSLKLYGNGLIRLPLTASVGYQTNFGRNYAFAANLTLPSLWERNHFRVSENIDYQKLQAEPANIRFSSYTATLGVQVFGFGTVRLPTLLLGASYAELSTLARDALATRAGGGYMLGLSSYLPFSFIGNVQATHWPGYWQWQGHLLHSLPGRLQAGVALNHLRSYSEVSASVSRTIW